MDDKILKIVKSFIPPAIYDRITLADGETSHFGERRRVTILFADINGFTPLLEQLDAEEALHLINSLFARLMLIIDKHGGVVDKFLGDAIMVLFGTPIAHEDDRNRALLCALDLRDEIGSICKDADFKSAENISISIGINTGLVVSGLVGGEEYREFTVLGNAVNIAARLQDLAENGEILVGYDTIQSYFNSYEYTAKEDIRLRGIKEKQTIYSIHGKKKTVNISKSLIKDDVFIGDEKIVLHIKDLLYANKPRSAFISGEAGIGKSYIAGHIAKEARSIGINPVIVQGVYWSRNSYMSAIRQILDQVRDKSRPNSLAGTDFEALSNYLEDGTSVGTDDLKKETISDYLVSILKDRIIVVDNFRYIDEGSIEILKAIAGDVPIAIFSREQIELSDFACIALTPLNRRQIRNAISLVLETDRIPSDLVDYIGSISRGLPGYIIGIISYLHESGFIDIGNGKILFKRGRSLPDKIDSFMSSRIDSLPEKLRQTILAASVLGDHFDLKTLDAVQVGASDKIDQIVSLGLIVRHGDRFAFGWNAVKQASYSLLLDINKKQMHKKAAIALETEYKEAPKPELLPQISYHYQMAEIPEKAFEYQYRTAMQQMQHSQETAMEYLEAISLYKNDEIERWGRYTEFYDALTTLGKIYWYQGELEKFSAICIRAARLSIDMKDDIAFARALNGIAIANDELGHLSSAYFAYNLALDKLAKIPTAKALRLQITANLGVMLSSNGDLEGALSVYKSVLSDALANPEWEASPQIFSGIAWVYRQLGKLEDAKDNYQKALELDIGQDNTHGLALDYLNLSAVLIDMHDLPTAKENLLKALRLFYNSGDIRGRISAIIAIGEVMRKMGDPKRAMHNHRLALKLTENAQDPYLIFDASIELYRDHSELGDIELAKQYLGKAKEIAITENDPELIDELKLIDIRKT